MTVRFMADSIVPSAMPDWVAVKCFYINGTYKAPQSVIDAWTGPKVLINVTGNPADGGDCIDVETFDAGPAAIPAWHDEQTRRGTRYLTVYCNRGNFDACTDAIGPRNVHRWLATLDGTVVTSYHGKELTAVQAFPSADFPTNIDGSLVFDPTWHPAPVIDLSISTIATMHKLSTVIAAEAADLRRIISNL